MTLFRFATFLLSIWTITSAGIVSSAFAMNTVGDFSLLDHEGTFHQLSWYGDQKALVLVTQANGDPINRSTAPALEALQTEFEPQGVTFFMINPNPKDSRESIVAEAQSHGYAMPILLDEAQLVAESLEIERTGEVLLINPATMAVVYRGAIQNGPDNQYLKDALVAVISNQAVAMPSSPSSGSPITFASREQHRDNTPSYVRDIVPILQNNCVDCHHEGGIGPWSMSSHAMVQGFSKMIREVVMTRRMPPGQTDAHVGKAIVDNMGLSIDEKQMLVHWINAGAPNESLGEDPLAAMVFDDPKYTLGEPDIIVKVPAQSIPATGILDYRYVPVELNLDRDVWVRAMETIPGDRQVLHHVIAYLSSPADKTARGRETGSARGEGIGGFAPGRQPDVFRDNSGRLVKKGSNLLLQMHYTTTGKASVDETEIGLFLYDEPPTYVMSGGAAGQRRFLVPAHAKEHKLEGEQLMERDAYLYSMMPHMHYRGKYMNYTAEYPDGSSELLLSVPRYEFNWQFVYRLVEPLFLPAGTRLVARGAMDNSARNPANPDPSKPVHFGLQTKHEMFFGFTTFRYVGDTPENFSGEKPNSKEDVAGL